jgi:hypothetical protein
LNVIDEILSSPPYLTLREYHTLKNAVVTKSTSQSFTSLIKDKFH